MQGQHNWGHYSPVHSYVVPQIWKAYPDQSLVYQDLTVSISYSIIGLSSPLVNMYITFTQLSFLCPDPSCLSSTVAVFASLQMSQFVKTPHETSSNSDSNSIGEVPAMLIHNLYIYMTILCQSHVGVHV